MKRCGGRIARLAAATISLTLVLAGCGGGGGTSATATTAAATQVGAVNLSITDAPGLEYANVWVTVKGVWFHSSADASDVSGDPGWVKVDLPEPVSIDLASLGTGNLQSLFAQPRTLPAGTYRQIRIFLASSNTQLAASAQNNGLQFNNEVRLPNDTTHYLLRVPGAEQGIKLIPESPVVVTAGGAVNLAFDFNIGEDVVKTARTGIAGGVDDVEFVLKPRVGFYDVNNAGAISGAIAPQSPFTFANYSGKNFVIRAEQPNRTDGKHRVALRTTTVKSDGSFFLYPLPIFGNATTATYDVVLRGLNVQTRIVTGVKVHKGGAATRSSLGPVVTMTRDTAPAYKVQASVNPSSAWVNFYQTLPGDPVPYLIRTRHIDPYSAGGTFYQPIELSRDPLQVAGWNNGGTLNFISTTPVEGAGSFSAVAQALLFTASAPQTVTPLTTSLAFGTLGVTGPATARQVSGTIKVAADNLNRGAIFAVQGGLIVNRLDASSLVQTGINSYTFGNLPGGLPDSSYSLYAVGWDATKPKASRVIGGPDLVDLRGGNGSANFVLSSF